MNLTDLGWNDYFNSQLDTIDTKDLIPGRIICRQKNIYQVAFGDGECQARVSGKYQHLIHSPSDFPVVGDWILMTPVEKGNDTIIHHLIKRRTRISRNAAGTSKKLDGQGMQEEQVMAANMDTVFIVCGLDRDFNLRRIERYLTTVYAGGAAPAIVLNKADLCNDPESRSLEVEAIAFGVPVHLMCAAQGRGVDALAAYFQEGRTAAFVGSSGVGKSTLINRLLGVERQKTAHISDKVGKGIHTTTHRELIPLPNGGLVLDNPGMRELQLWDTGEAVSDLFEDIESHAKYCRFSDCQHQQEPGCAVKAAMAEGSLDAKRLESYFKLKREEAFFSQRQSKSADAIEKEKWRKIRLVQRKFYKG